MSGEPVASIKNAYSFSIFGWKTPKETYKSNVVIYLSTRKRPNTQNLYWKLEVCITFNSGLDDISDTLR